MVSIFRPTPVFKILTFARKRQLALWARNVVRNTLGGAIDASNPVEAGFEPARICFRAANGFLVLVALVFFEAALVIGSQTATLTGRMSGQSDQRLCSWTVLHDSALEESAVAVFTKGRVSINILNTIDGITLNQSKLPTERRWSTCETLGECFQQLANEDKVAHLRRDRENKFCTKSTATVNYIVAFETIVLEEFKRNPQYCQTLEVVATEDRLERFMSGFMFAPMLDEVGRKLRLGIDKGILRARRLQR